MSLIAENVKGKSGSFYSPVPKTCFVCGEGAHKLLSCLKFSNANAKQRLQWLDGWKGCRNCLSYNHKTSECNSKWHCRFCKRYHHSMLHLDQPVKVMVPQKVSASEVSSSSTSNVKTVLASSASSDIPVLLGTAIALIQDSRGVFQSVRLVIDSGSQYSFITMKCINRLGLPLSRFDKRISGIGQTMFDGAKGLVSCSLRPLDSNEPLLNTEAVVVKNIASLLPSFPLPSHIRKQYRQYSLADPQFWEPASVDFLLGADLFGDIWTGPAVTLNESIPKLLPSIFGFVIIGRCHALPSVSDNQSFFVMNDNSDLTQNLQRFWEIEEPLPSVKALSLEDEMCEDHFVRTHYRNEDGRYVVRLPFKVDSPSFGNTKDISLRRFENLEKKLERNPELKIQYHEFMQEYSDLGHMSLTSNESKFTIPHHSVIKEGRNKLKLRVVFDASVHSFSNSSLNECLMAGPKLQNDIRDVLLNFRSHCVAFVADVVKMYRNILLDENDRPYQHILWRFDRESEVKVYELNTVTYGLTSAPFLALRVIQQLQQDEGHRFPDAASVIVRDMYVDDLVTGCDSVTKALELQKQVIDLFAQGGFALSKWASNCNDILQAVPNQISEEVATSISSEDSSLKVLGLQWNSKEDYFGFRVVLQNSVTSKRGILSMIAKIYDPLGFISPTVFLMKTFIQELWKEKLTWDQDIPPRLAEQWQQVIRTLPDIAQVKVPRFVCTQHPFTYQIVGFADASTKGYCAVLYIRCITADSTKVNLLTSKTKLAPLNTVSIPRLELCGALLLCRLYKSISSFLRLLPQSCLEPCFFTDSTIVLGWINTPSYNLKTFVANRVSELQTSTSVHWWKHITSSSNPSDCGSRGMMPEDLVKHSLWWSGPTWLQYGIENWPCEDTKVSEDPLPELKSKPLSLFTTPDELPIMEWISRFSSFHRLLRVFCWMFRFIHNSRNKTNARCGPIQLSELKYATTFCFRMVQLYYIFDGDIENKDDVFKKYAKLTPFLDQDGILRVGGRLRHSDLSHDQKFPILLPKSCHLTIILVDSYHKTYLHPGPALLQAFVQQKFWIPSLRRLVQQRTFQCLKCYKLKARQLSPLMGDLPAYRLTCDKAFTHVGIDFGGPFIMRESLRRKSPQSKVYLCLFVCMGTKALHLELVTRLTTDAFLASLDRFVSRRGLPSHIYSDCGSNFVGAASHLKDLLLWFNSETTKEHCLDYSVKLGIQWSFNPPHSPHFGGLWEGGIKSVKRLLRTVAGDNPLTYEELSTYLIKVESILNSRPLCPLPSHPEDMDYLTPGHFLVGTHLQAIPEPSHLDLKENTLTRWQLVKRLSEHFWKRWRLEYLSTLQVKNKWTKSQKNIKVGDIVLLKDDNVPVMRWPLARVEKTHPGADGVVRVATVRTSTSTYRRPTVKLVPLLPLDVPAFGKS